MFRLTPRGRARAYEALRGRSGDGLAAVRRLTALLALAIVAAVLLLVMALGAMVDLAWPPIK